MNTQSTPSESTEPPVWFITGCSSGFGLELARQAIERGYRMVVTARDLAKLPGYVANDQVLVLQLDVTQPDQVAVAVKAAQARFGGIDVLVNNAGIGYFAAIEEGDAAEVRKMFDVNVFGLTAMIQAVLPGMRRRHRGCIVNLSSLAGLRGMPALGQYNATKFAVEGLSEALRREVEPLGIQVMVVNPSGFRTDWAGRSANESEHPIEDYLATAGKVRLWRCAHRPASSLATLCVPSRPSSRPWPRASRRTTCCWATTPSRARWQSSTNCARNSRRARPWRAALTFRRKSHDAQDAGGAGRAVAACSPFLAFKGAGRCVRWRTDGPARYP